MQSSPKPAYSKGFLWFLFSGTAMLSALVLPIHFLMMLFFPFVFMRLDSILTRGYFFVLFFAALYHGLYRTETVLIDLGLGRFSKIINPIIWVIFLISVAASFYLFFVADNWHP